MKAEIKEQLGRNLAQARWDKAKQFERVISMDWQTEDLATVKERVEALLKNYHEASRIYSQRVRADEAETRVCMECGKTGFIKWAMTLDLPDANTGTRKSFFLCTPVCALKYQTKSKGGVPK